MGHARIGSRASEGVRPAPGRVVRLGLSGLLALTVLSCASVSVKKTDPLKMATHMTRDVLGTGRLSEESFQTLRLHHLDNFYRNKPLHALAGLKAIYALEPSPNLLACISEIAYIEGRKADQSGRADLAASLYLMTAAHTFDYLFGAGEFCVDKAFDNQYYQMQRIYNFSVGRYISLYQAKEGTLKSHRASYYFEEVDIDIGDWCGVYTRSYFDTFIPATEVAIRGFRNRYLHHGLGAPLIALRENLGKEPMERFYPPEGIVHPMTATLKFERVYHAKDGRPRRAWLQFHDPRASRHLDSGSGTIPLAADFTAPYAYLLDRADLDKYRFRGLRNSQKSLAHQGVYLMEPYDPEQVPVLMVHGLGSTPATWLELTNDLNGDPHVRDNYQIWHYMYPTGYPFLYSGKIMRDTLDAFMDEVDPERDDPAMKDLVVLCHSMGGLLTRTLVTHSGDDVWNAAFDRKLEDMDLEAGQRAFLSGVFQFQPKPYVSRVVFISVPHQGSRMADGWIGRLGSSLVRLPEQFKNRLNDIMARNPGVVKPETAELFARRGPTSIKALSPTRGIVRVFGKLPIDRRVAVHSILGDRGKGQLEGGSDGVVPYESAHLDDVASELVVPSGHDAHTHPLAIIEIKRILTQHLRERYSGPMTSGVDPMP
ncbi:AB hydrolase-1 domain-containing protein [Sulfidibacter corallicola]|uniref:AB hydrolase-1 domain-containing protein n=1 Tax=Sulfidibacter corallicola TaxID=2818388 RepID=A0A8A4TBT6_SULCO|nr:alpha/beta fold hydrolase [Sulfidibacter corallicola]QTD47579.1 hypothetical protein J3U87_18460 [Sulfidibacter corallicola]